MPYASLEAGLRASLQIFGVGFGAGTGAAGQHWGLGILLVWLLTLASLAWTWLTQARERHRALGLFLILAAQGGLILVLGQARSGLGAEYIASGIYVNLAGPVVCAIYLAWERYGSKALGTLIQVCLFTVMCLLFLTNMNLALTGAREFHSLADKLQQDVSVGQPAFVLAERHAFWLYPWPDHERSGVPRRARARHGVATARRHWHLRVHARHAEPGGSTRSFNTGRREPPDLE